MAVGTSCPVAEARRHAPTRAIRVEVAGDGRRCTAIVRTVHIEVSHEVFLNLTAINALDKVVLKYRREGAGADIVGFMRRAKPSWIAWAVRDKPGAMAHVAGH